MLDALLLWPLRSRVMPVHFPGARPVLDIGCGNGQRLLELQAAGCTQLTGIEPTQGAAEQARLATKAAIHTGLLEDAELQDDHFQLVILNQVLEHVPSPRDTLLRIHQLLCRGGELYLTVPNYGSGEAALFGRHWYGLQIPTHLHHFTAEPLRRLLEEAGFEVVVWRTDTALGVTRSSIEAWCEANPSPWRRWLGTLPVLLFAPLTVMTDLVGKGQMLRVVVRKV